MKGWKYARTNGLGVRRFAALGVALVLSAGVAGCDDGDPIEPDVLDLEVVEGLYEVLTITFDPSGAAPAADVLVALESGGISPTLNIGRTGSFQLFYRDQADGNVKPILGEVEPTSEGVDLVFPSQSSADHFVFPLRVPLGYDADSEILSFSGAADVSRVRLQQLFPELYGEEPWTSQTIPGILTMAFQKSDD